jgi:hypothetical protein
MSLPFYATCFNMETGVMAAMKAQIKHTGIILYQYAGWTPYYARDGCYVGCCCYVPEYRIKRFYNPVSGKYVKSYEELAW